MGRLTFFCLAYQWEPNYYCTDSYWHNGWHRNPAFCYHSSRRFHTTSNQQNSNQTMWLKKKPLCGASEFPYSTIIAINVHILLLLVVKDYSKNILHCPSHLQPLQQIQDFQVNFQFPALGTMEVNSTFFFQHGTICMKRILCASFRSIYNMSNMG